MAKCSFSIDWFHARGDGGARERSSVVQIAVDTVRRRQGKAFSSNKKLNGSHALAGSHPDSLLIAELW